MHTLFDLGVSNLIMAGVLCVAAVVLGFMIRRPALIHALWVLVFLKLITPPLFSVPIWSPATQNPPVAMAHSIAPAQPPKMAPETVRLSPPQRFLDPEFVAPPANGDVFPIEPAPIENCIALEKELPIPIEQPKFVETESQRPMLHMFGRSWKDILAWIWAAGAVVWFATAAIRLIRFQKMLRFAKPVDETLQQQALTIAESIGVRCPAVREMPGVVAPMVWVMGRRPLLLVPADLRHRLSGEQIATLLAHELAHLRRRDYWVRWLEMLVLGLYWWCPVVWWARSRLRQTEEECCDAWVVWALPNLTRAYAYTLVETVDFLAETRSPLPIGASGFGQVQQLQRRLKMILRGKTPRTLKITGFLVLFATAGLLLPLAPGFAERPGEKERESDEKFQKGERDERGEKKRGESPERREGDGDRKKKFKRDDDRGEKDKRKKFREEDEKNRSEYGELRRWAERLEKMKRELDEQRRALEDKTRFLEMQFKKLREAQKSQFSDDKKRNPFGDPRKPREGENRPPFPGGPNPPVMKRLGELEQQLHRILMEIHELRKSAGPQRPSRYEDKLFPNFKPRPDGERPKFSPKKRPRPDGNNPEKRPRPDGVFAPQPPTAAAPVDPARVPSPDVAPPASPALPVRN